MVKMNRIRSFGLGRKCFRLRKSCRSASCEYRSSIWRRVGAGRLLGFADADCRWLHMRMPGLAVVDGIE